MSPFLFISSQRPPSEDRDHYNEGYEPEQHPAACWEPSRRGGGVKPGRRDLLGETNYHWWEKAESFHLSSDQLLRSHYIMWAVGYSRDAQTLLLCADLVVGLVQRCIFTLWSLATRRSAPSPSVLWRPSQLVWNDSMVLVVSFETLLMLPAISLAS